MRMITGQAGVNLAAVNYHFGTKESLIQEIFEKRLDALNGRRVAALDEVVAHARRSGRALRPSEVLEAFFRPALELAADTEQGGHRFMRLLGRTHTETSPFVQRFLAGRYAETLQRFLAVLCAALPGVPREEILWRFYFMMGATSYAIAGTDNLQVFEGRFDQHDPTQLIPRLMAFLLGGLAAPLPGQLEGPPTRGGSSRG